MTGSMIEMSEMLHLKTGVNYLDNDKLLICGEFIGKPEFADFDHIEIDAENAYSANSVWINDTVFAKRSQTQRSGRCGNGSQSPIKFAQADYIAHTRGLA